MPWPTIRPGVGSIGLLAIVADPVRGSRIWPRTTAPPSGHADWAGETPPSFWSPPSWQHPGVRLRGSARPPVVRPADPMDLGRPGNGGTPAFVGGSDQPYPSPSHAHQSPHARQLAPEVNACPAGTRWRRRRTQGRRGGDKRSPKPVPSPARCADRAAARPVSRLGAACAWVVNLAHPHGRTAGYAS